MAQHRQHHHRSPKSPSHCNIQHVLLSIIHSQITNPSPNLILKHQSAMATTVTETLDALPCAATTHTVHRSEPLLLTHPTPPPHPPLAVAHFRLAYAPGPFAPPRDVFGGDALRLERQQMRGRQPFWHRNVDVDELSFQCAGERTLMTELGSRELRGGDWSRIPVGVAHDNYGRAEVHLLFYVHAEAVECGGVVGRGEVLARPFEGWVAGEEAAEVTTECLGARGCDVAVSLAEERVLLAHGEGVGERIVVQRAEGGGDGEYEWMYKAKEVWTGAVTLRNCSGEAYRRHRKADEIQCQISGRRLLVSQRGAVELEPGDFVCVPKGCAFTSVAEESFHTSVLTTQEAPMKAEVARTAEVDSAGLIRDARERVKKHVA